MIITQAVCHPIPKYEIRPKPWFSIGSVYFRVAFGGVFNIKGTEQGSTRGSFNDPQQMRRRRQKIKSLFNHIYI